MEQNKGYLPAQKITACAVMAFLLLFPLVVGPEGYRTITHDKFMVCVTMCGLYAAALFCCAVVCRLRRQPFAGSVGLPAAVWLLSAYMAWMVLSAALSAHGSTVWLGLSRYHGLCSMLLCSGLALAVCCFGSWRRSYLLCAAAAALVMAAVCFWQLAGGNPLGLYPQGTGYTDANVRYGGVFLGLIGNIDMLSGYWCMLLPILTGGAVLCRGWLRLLPAASAVCGFMVLLCSGVAGGLLAVAVTALLMLPLYVKKRYRKVAVLGIVLVIVLLLLLCYLCGGNMQGTVYELHCLLHGQVNDSFGSSRILIWKDALDGFTQWLTGSGPGTRATHFSTVFERTVASGSVITVKVDSAHSEYLDCLLELGLPGLLLYLALLGLATVNMLRYGQKEPWRLLVGGAVLCYALQACFNFSVVVTSPLFWVLLGLQLCSKKPPQAEHAAEAGKATR